MKKIILILICLLTFQINVMALNYRGCDTKIVSDLKAFVNNVNISYSYKEVNNNILFSVTINNITPDMYFIDSITRKQYNYSNTNNGEITIGNYGEGVSGNYKFYSAKGGCYGISLGTKYFKLPSYNYFYDDPLCKDAKELNVCKRWIKLYISKAELEDAIYEYKNPKVEENVVETKKTFIDNLIDFYVKYYYLILIGVIVICVLIITIKRKKDSFNLKNK